MQTEEEEGEEEEKEGEEEEKEEGEGEEAASIVNIVCRKDGQEDTRKEYTSANRSDIRGISSSSMQTIFNSASV